MPIYEYCCSNCSERFSVLQSISVREHETKCPKCGSFDVKKMMSAFSCSSGSGQGFTSSSPSGGLGGG